MKSNIIPAIRLTLICLVLFPGIYMLAVWGIAQLTPGGGKGETIFQDGKTYYSNIGHSFTEDKYFYSRPSAVGYNAAGSGGSNKGPNNPDYLAQVQERIDTFLVHNPGISKSEIPIDLVRYNQSEEEDTIPADNSKDISLIVSEVIHGNINPSDFVIPAGYTTSTPAVDTFVTMPDSTAWIADTILVKPAPEKKPAASQKAPTKKPVKPVTNTKSSLRKQD